jgi:hypothetical protein
LEDETGAALQTFRQGATTWVLGERGQRFVIVLFNPTPERVEAVVSVDGRDVLSGRVASFRTQRGYIVPAHGTTRIEGFRQSLDHVAAFRFSDAEESYSARMGTAQNVGVIGVAFFRERPRESPVWVPEERSDRWRRPAPPRKSRAPSAGTAAREADRDSNIGTEYGETRVSPVREVPFDRISNTPTRIITIRYDDAAGLEARGIDLFRRPPPRPFAPTAFPDPGFAPPPRPFAPTVFPDPRFAPPPPS